MIYSIRPVCLPFFVRQQLRKIQGHLQRVTSSGRFVHEKNMHLTLQFLGDVSEQQLPGIVAALRQVACQIPTFSLSLGVPGVFGNSNPYRVVWLGLAGELGLLRQLQVHVEKSMAGLGFTSEHRSYQPHITLGRDVAFHEHEGSAWTFDQRGRNFTVQYFTLIASVLEQGKRIYRPIEHFCLSDAGRKKEDTPV